MTDDPAGSRDAIFLSKATPLDNEFALWLAPRLEAAGYSVFCDILTLTAGDRWRTEITSNLQQRAAKMLLVSKNDTLQAAGVLEELEIACDLAKSIPDPKFIIPLRMKAFDKVFGMGGFQYVNFEPGWAQGLIKLLEQLRKLKAPRIGTPVINPHWETFRRRGAIPLKREPERLTSNWLPMRSAPDHVFYYEPVGACDRNYLESKAAVAPYPVEMRPKGILTFASLEEVNQTFETVGRLQEVNRYPLVKFLQEGAPELGLQLKDANNVMVSMVRQAWIAFATARNLLEYKYSNAIGFHIGPDQAKVGQRVAWGRQGERRSAMLRNIARGVVWQYGVTVQASFWPYPHLRLKSRVLFAPPKGEDAGEPFDDKKKQHKLRRTVCKGWRNRQWQSRLLAFLEMLSGESSSFALPLSPSAIVVVDAAPQLFTSPVSTALPKDQADDDEETDESTLGKPEPEEDEV
jgi:hypothetical protein